MQVLQEAMLDACLVRTELGVELRRRPAQRISAPDQVAVRVSVAGICRTDLHVADGRIDCETPRVLGHEVAGVVVECGSAVNRVHAGDRVAVEPFVPCGRCSACHGGAPPHQCPSRRMLGLDCDGAFSGMVVAPATCVHPVPDCLEDIEAAYVEPLAAAMAIAEWVAGAGSRGVVLGSGRIAELSRRVLRAVGVEAETLDPDRTEVRPGAPAQDFVVETRGTEETLRAAVARLRFGGLLVLKSRPALPAPLDIREVVRKRLRIVGAEYGDFETAIEWLATGRIQVHDLVGPVFPIERFREAFAAARRSEDQKVFLQPGSPGCVA